MDDENQQDPETSGLVYAGVIGVVVFLIFYVLFELLRSKRPHIFLYRKYLLENKIKYPEYKDENGNFQEYPTPLPSRAWLSWLRASQSVSDDDIVRTISYDAAMVLISLRNKLYFFLITGFLLCVMLLPTYATSKRSPSIKGLGFLSMANLEEDDWRLWITFIGDLLFVCFGLLYIFYEAGVYTRRREQYRSEDIGANYAIAVQDLPNNIQTAEQVKAAFDVVFPGEVEGAQIVYKSPFLAKKFKIYAKALNKRENAEWTFLYGKKKERPRHHVTPCTCCCTGTVDSLEYWADLQKKTAEEIASAQGEMDTRTVIQTRSAIVTFRTKRAASLADQTQIFTRPLDKWTITRLDSFKAVHWPGIRKGRLIGILFTIHTWFWMVVFLAFWSGITLAIQSVADLTQLATQPAFSWLEPILNLSPVLKGLLEGYVPVILQIVLAMLPVILIQIFVGLERYPSVGLLANQKRTMVFILLFFVNFIYVVVAGTVLDQLQALINSPTMIVELLAIGIPVKATFFLNLALTQCFIGNGLALSQIVRVIVVPIGHLLFGRTPRNDKTRMAFGSVFGFAGTYGSSAFLGTVAIVYSSIQPLILLVVALYMGLTYIVSKHNICYTMYNGADNGGSMFWGHLQITFVALYIRQLVMIGLYGLNKAPVPAAVSVVSLIPLVYSHIYICTRYQRLGWEGSLEYTGTKVAEMDVDAGYVAKYKTPELKKVNEVPVLLEFDALRVRKEEEDADVETGATGEKQAKAQEDEFYDSQVNEDIVTADA